jgi:4'-phosphopantetheinyl transferase
LPGQSRCTAILADRLPIGESPHWLYYVDVVLATDRGDGTDQLPAPSAAQLHDPILLDEIHVWRASLERPGADVERLRLLLAADEQQRADRFRFDRDRFRYIVGRAQLRVLLGRYLGLVPEQVRFEYGAFEKPRLAHPGPSFNLTHSGPVALYAFTAAGEIGVDVELDDADFAKERIAERFFSAAEVAVLRSLPERLQARAFLTCWTRKEAFIKARGDGLSLALDSFDVSLEPGAPAALLRTAWSTEETRKWYIEDLSDPDAGYVAAMALSGNARRVVKRDLF